VIPELVDERRLSGPVLGYLKLLWAQLVDSSLVLAVNLRHIGTSAFAGGTPFLVVCINVAGPVEISEKCGEATDGLSITLHAGEELYRPRTRSPARRLREHD
jgi:hypothetical protein